ncbi:putative 1-aminocyclopropane-1-carboxylate oxidase -like protein 1-like [Capsicum annuum]|nr:putative 1-aminocyclopropane-1-carboxylate oxidase -like protein 1-like [Capsicum annuum]
MKLGDTLFELLSEAIGLEPNHLKDMGCSEGLMALGHYYPVCPQPELTLGTHKNAENDFLIVLLQDNRGGPTLSVGGVRAPLISNDKFKSVDHRVLANKVGPRVSLACFFMTNFVSRQRRYGPIKDLERSHLERDKGGKADMVWTCEQKMHRCSSEDELEVGYSGCKERHQ